MGNTSSKRSKKSRSIPEDRPAEKSTPPSTSTVVAVSLTPGVDPTATPISRDGSLSSQLVDTWEASVALNTKLTLSRSVFPQNDIQKTLQSRQARTAAVATFNHVLKHSVGPITDQGSSGRCWLFAATNVLRYKMMKSHDLRSFQLSQSYLSFWDKLNKANYFLELSIQLADVPLEDSRLVSMLHSVPTHDGGAWDMAINLFEVFPESHHSSDSGAIHELVNTKLREHSLILRSLAASLRNPSSGEPSTEEAIVDALRVKKESLMKEVYTILTTVFGAVPSPDEKFVWEASCSCCSPNKNWEGTPKEFYERVVLAGRYNPSESLNLGNDPRNEYNRIYSVDKYGNVWGGRPVRWLNVEIEKLKEAVVAMIKNDYPVFFGCDIEKFTDRQRGVMDTTLFEYEISLGLSKADRLRFCDSTMTHAMVITGVHLQSGKPVRYKVENSWGSGHGKDGFFVMLDRWFEEYVYQVVVHKPYAPSEFIEIWENAENIVLPPWDNLGHLARI